MRERARAYSTTLRRATLAAIEHGAKEGAAVYSATAVEDAGGIVMVYCTDVDGNSNAGMVADVLLELDEWRAAGVVVNVVGGSLYTLTPIILSLQVRVGVDTQALVAAVKTAIVARLDRLKIGETAYRSAIQAAALNVNVNILGCTVTTPAADVVPGDQQMIRTTAGDIQVS